MSHFYLSLYLVDFLVEEGFFSAGFFPLGEAFAIALSAFFAGDFPSVFFGAFCLAGFSFLDFVFGSGISAGSTFSTLRVSPGLPMKSTVSREYC
jgi:hypothetical protein